MSKMFLRLIPLYGVATVAMFHVVALTIGPTTYSASQHTDKYGYFRRQDTSEVSSCGGYTSYFACPFELGGGCCPQGLLCGPNGACTSSGFTSTTTTILCDQGWFACASRYGGGCCLGGGICGPGDCTFYVPATTTIIPAISGGQTDPVVSTINSTSLTSQTNPTITSYISTQVSGTETSSRIFTTTVLVTNASSGGGVLTGGQIGGTTAGVVVGFLLLEAFGWLIIRHLIRISRFMDKFDDTRGASDKSATKEGASHTRDTEPPGLDNSNIATEQAITEMSPQERPQMLEEWGRHGSRGTELPGSYTAHGVSELDSSSVART